MSIDRATIHKVAHLARLRVNEAEEKTLKDRLDRILSWVEQLEEVKTDTVEPMYSMYLDQMPQRPDTMTDGQLVKPVLANAPEADFDMFVVPKVVE